MAESTESGSNDFWRFAIDRYGRDGVSQRCLDLQDRLGADVCVALFCLWKGQEGVSVPRETLAAIDEGEIGIWHRDVVQPLRMARRAMKLYPAALDPESVEADRTRVKLAELAAEKQQTAMLALVPVDAPTGLGRKGDHRAIGIENLTNYLSALRSSEGDSAQELASDLGRLCID
jgi:uncharacterized protein (TIGR02444 family)